MFDVLLQLRLRRKQCVRIVGLRRPEADRSPKTIRISPRVTTCLANRRFVYLAGISERDMWTCSWTQKPCNLLPQGLPAELNVASCSRLCPVEPILEAAAKAQAQGHHHETGVILNGSAVCLKRAWLCRGREGIVTQTSRRNNHRQCMVPKQAGDRETCSSLAFESR